jgi:hypothetical protein
LRRPCPFSRRASRAATGQKCRVGSEIPWGHHSAESMSCFWPGRGDSVTSQKPGSVNFSLILHRTVLAQAQIVLFGLYVPDGHLLPSLSSSFQDTSHSCARPISLIPIFRYSNDSPESRPYLKVGLPRFSLAASVKAALEPLEGCHSFGPLKRKVVK